jgi:class 3 adenylate cyclase
MPLGEELESFVSDALAKSWSRRNGRIVPTSDDVTFGNDAVDLNATVLYADLAESTGLVEGYKDWFAAKVYKTYLYCAAKIIRARGGEITAYDGDRIMAVFIGDSRNTSAAKCALQINFAARKVVQPAIEAKYDTEFVLRQKVGVDASSLMVAKTGIRGSNDLVWVGNAANRAAKMAALPTKYASYITVKVFNNMADSSKFGGKQNRNMWTDLGSADLGYRIYGSNWTWSL